MQTYKELIKLHKFYGQPVKCAPFGLSDHMYVELKPKDRSPLQKVHKSVVWKRDLRPSSRFAFRKYLELLDIPNMFDKVVPSWQILPFGNHYNNWVEFYHAIASYYSSV